MTASEVQNELLAAIHELAQVAPQMRTGQLVAALGELCGDIHGHGLWEAEDGELLEAARQFRRNYEAALATPSPREA